MGNPNYRICANCIMDTSDSGIVFDERGWCDYCNNYHRNILPNWHTDERKVSARSWPKSSRSSAMARARTMTA